MSNTNANLNTKKFTDVELVKLLQGGSQKAFYALVEKYEGKVMGLAMRFTKNVQDAEEVCQDVFTTVYLKASDFEGKSAFSSWLYRIVVNTSFMKLRKRKLTDAISIEELTPNLKQEYVEQYGESFERSDDASSKKEILDALETAIQKLPEEYRTVFVLRDLNGLSSEETSTTLNISVAAVKSRLHRSRVMLKKKLEGHWNDYTGKAARPQLAMRISQAA